MIKVTQADRWFALCVKERVEYVCEKCGKQYEKGAQGLHCSHLFSRRHRSVRHHSDNAFAHCMGCHQYLGGNPVLFAAWAESALGEARLEFVKERHRAAIKWTKGLEKEIAAHYKAQHEEMLKKRAAGVIGRLEFASFW